MVQPNHFSLTSATLKLNEIATESINWEEIRRLFNFKISMSELRGKGIPLET